jgi:hypothetical protein
VVGQQIIREDAAGPDVGTHRLTPWLMKMSSGRTAYTCQPSIEDADTEASAAGSVSCTCWSRS